jgi:hypothetical protein
MYKSLEEHLNDARSTVVGETAATERASAAQTLVMTRIQERKLEQIERDQLRQERFGQFVVAATTLGKLLGDEGIKPDVMVHRSRFGGLRGKRVLSGWAVKESFQPAHAAGTDYEIDGLARTPNGTSHEAAPASIEQLLVTTDRGVVRYTGEPSDLKPVDGDIHHGHIVVKHLKMEQLSGASLASGSDESPDPYMAWLANNIVRFNVDPGQFGLPTYEARHALAE